MSSFIAPLSPRLSVILTCTNQRGAAEKSIGSILNQTDPIGTEIVVVDNGSTDDISDYLKSIFPDAFSSGRLRVQSFPRKLEPGVNANRGADLSRGSFLAFITPGDEWRAGRIARLEPLLQKHDLIVATEERLSRSSDWLNSFLWMNWATPGSSVIRRTLLDEAGGFPEGLFSESEYKLWLECLTILKKMERLERFQVIQNDHIVPAAGPGKGTTTGLPLPPQLQMRVRGLKETLSVLQMARRLPARYWPTALRRVITSSKKLFKS